MIRILRTTACIALIASLLAGGAAKSFGQTAAVASGNWSTAGTWSAGEPTDTLAATINGGLTVTIDQTSEITNLLDVGTVAGEVGNLNITGGDLTIFDSDTVTAPNLPSIRLGQVAGSTGNLTMSGGTVFIDGASPSDFAIGEILVGDNGTGTMTMTGGDFTASDEIFLGLGAGSNGTMSVSGGVVNVAGRNLLVGFSGANPGAGLAGAHGVLNISGTGDVNVDEVLFSSFGNQATSTINQTGGSLNMGTLVMARQGDSTYNHSAGEMTANVVVIADNFEAAPGVPNTPGAVGTYNLSGSATASASAITWLGAFSGGVGIVNQTGGSYSSGAFGIGRDGTGTWNISSGTLTQTGTDGFTPNNHFVVGQVGGHTDFGQGTGTVNQTGGTVTINTGVFLGDFDNSEGTFKISGGTLNVTGTGVHTNPGTFEDFIGDFSVGGALASNAEVGRVDPANPDDAQGQALDANGTFIVSGSAATIDIAGNFLANPADKHANRKDDQPGDTNRANSATLGFEIFNASGTSLIDVAGIADLDGAVIDIDLMGGFLPSVGATFNLLEASSFGATGTGTTQNVGTGEGFILATEDVGVFGLAVVPGAGVETLRATFLGAVAADADFDNDGDVDGADFLTWQRGLGLSGAAATNAAGNANGDTVIDGADLTVWRNEFGPPSVPAAGAVPEPSVAALLLIAAAGFAASRTATRSGRRLA